MIRAALFGLEEYTMKWTAWLYQAERKGVPAEDAIAMGKAAGLSSLESTVRQILGV